MRSSPAQQESPYRQATHTTTTTTTTTTATTSSREVAPKRGPEGIPTSQHQIGGHKPATDDTRNHRLAEGQCSTSYGDNASDEHRTPEVGICNWRAAGSDSSAVASGSGSVSNNQSRDSAGLDPHSQTLNCSSLDNKEQQQRQKQHNLDPVSHLQNSSPIRLQEQRIKVTLSAPPNSEDQDQVAAVVPRPSGETAPDSVEQQRTSNEEEEKESARRQSTATLISAPDSSPSTTPQAGSGGLSRSEQEGELIRIASQRRHKKLVQGTTGEQPASARDTDASGNRLELATEKKGQQQQKQQQLSPEPSAKQLAIYINGKIRSNSIFCRSRSSNSFNGLLNRFQPGSGQESSTGALVGNKQVDEEPLCPGNKQLRTLDKRRLNSPSSVPSSLGAAFLRLLAGPWLARGETRPCAQVEKQEKELRSPSGAGSEQVVEGEEEDAQKTSYKLNPSSMFLRKAMRYYRLWIYCTNITILLGALIFILASIYVASDFRIRLLVGGGGRSGSKSRGELGDNGSSEISLSYTEPSVLLAYVAIAAQAGLLQAIGCFGAVRMRERWIQAFWYLILALTVFDIVFVVYWFGRYELIVKSLRHRMTHRLSHHYGGHSAFSNHSLVAADDNESSLLFGSSSSSSGQLHKLESDFDKILTEIVDKIQADSRCCGISSSLDYKQSEWRRTKLEQLRSHLQWTDSVSLALIRQVPLVPASCCRPRASDPEGRPLAANPPAAILDDSQTHVQRVPAWSPSMVVEELHSPQQRRQRQELANKRRPSSGGDPPDAYSDEDYDGGESGERQSLAELMDARWTGRVVATSDEPNIGGAPERRRLAKVRHFNSKPDGSSLTGASRRRRWVVESTVDEQGRTLSRFIDDAAGSLTPTGLGDGTDDDRADLSAPRAHNYPTSDETAASSIRRAGGRTELDEAFQMAAENHLSDKDNGRELKRVAARSALDTNNQLDTLKGILLTQTSVARRTGVMVDSSEVRQTGVRANKLRLNPDEFKMIENYLLSERRAVNTAKEPQQMAKKLIASGNRHKRRQVDTLAPQKEPTQVDQLRSKLAEAIRLDGETSCAPRSYYDRSSIYTRGCHQDLKAWLDSSAHILFVVGFCVLTLLKFCSLILLRLEIREMIHKIRVLKGMATEYNALHDLEAYLPRPSVSAQAAELTPSGVALASPSGAALSASQVVAATAAAAASGSGSVAGQTVPSHHHHRIGGSFSEAVVAATAQQQQQLGFNSSQLSGRAVSMKAMAAMSAGMHLHTPDLLMASAGNLVSQRRHTAVSVCPAAVAAAAAQHLFSRRGTYVDCGQPAGSCHAFPLGPTLGQHRHSAHTVQTLLAAKQHQQAPSPTGHHHSPMLKQQQSSTSKYSSRSRQFLGDKISAQAEARAAALEHQSSGESQAAQDRSAGLYPFKRQSSGGAQSADCSYHPYEPAQDSTAQSLADSRRSIH